MPHAYARRPLPPAWLTTRPIAHRGLHDPDAPENSLPAFEAAVSANYPIELDVHVLSDGEVIVFHDDDLLRATGTARQLAQENRTSIRAHRLFGTSHRIPTLREVFELVAGRVPMLVEIKARARHERTEQAVLDCLSAYAGPLAIQSFNPWTLAWFGEHAPHLVRGQLGGPMHDERLSLFERVASRRLLTAAASRPTFVNYDLRALPDRWLTLLSHALALPVLAWTVRSAADRAKAEALGVNYVFDHIRP